MSYFFKITLFLVLVFFSLFSNCNKPREPEEVKDLLEAHNLERKRYGANPLQKDEYLENYAKNHAGMMANKNRLYHSDISVLLSRYRTSGENIAWNQRTEKQVMSDWMNSPGHKSNILNKKYSKVGFGKSENSKGEPYWCTVFAD